MIIKIMRNIEGIWYIGDAQESVNDLIFNNINNLYKYNITNKVVKVEKVKNLDLPMELAVKDLNPEALKFYNWIWAGACYDLSLDPYRSKEYQDYLTFYKDLESNYTSLWARDEKSYNLYLDSKGLDLSGMECGGGYKPVPIRKDIATSWRIDKHPDYPYDYVNSGSKMIPYFKLREGVSFEIKRVIDVYILTLESLDRGGNLALDSIIKSLEVLKNETNTSKV